MTINVNVNLENAIKYCGIETVLQFLSLASYKASEKEAYYLSQKVAETNRTIINNLTIGTEIILDNYYIYTDFDPITEEDSCEVTLIKQSGELGQHELFAEEIAHQDYALPKDGNEKNIGRCIYMGKDKMYCTGYTANGKCIAYIATLDVE